MRFSEISTMTLAQVNVERMKYKTGSEQLLYKDSVDGKYYVANDTIIVEFASGSGGGFNPESIAADVPFPIYTKGTFIMFTSAGLAGVDGPSVEIGDVIYTINDTLAGNYSDPSVGSNMVLIEHGFFVPDKYVAFGSSVGVEGDVNFQYDKTKRSLQHGNVAVASGDDSSAEGNTTTASGTNAHAEGANTRALSSQSHAEGVNTKAGNGPFVGINAHAEGNSTQAIGNNSHAEGNETKASGNYSHAEGSSSNPGVTGLASGIASHVEGGNCIASGEAAHAEGENTIAEGDLSHAEGNGSHSIARHSHAENRSTRTFGENSHAEGVDTVTGDVADPTNFLKGANAHAEGNTTIAKGVSSHSEGAQTQSNGIASHSEGTLSHADSVNAHAEGEKTVAGDITQPILTANAHAEGYKSQALGFASHSEGQETIVNPGSIAGHVEGYKSEVVGTYAHAEGNQSTAVGNHSHAEGMMSNALRETENAQGSGMFVKHGDAQNMRIPLKKMTLTNLAEVMLLPEGSVLNIEDNTVWTYILEVVGVDITNGLTIGLFETGLIKNISSVSSLVSKSSQNYSDLITGVITTSTNAIGSFDINVQNTDVGNHQTNWVATLIITQVQF